MGEAEHDGLAQHGAGEAQGRRRPAEQGAPVHGLLEGGVRDGERGGRDERPEIARHEPDVAEERSGKEGPDPERTGHQHERAHERQRRDTTVRGQTKAQRGRVSRDSWVTRGSPPTMRAS